VKLANLARRLAWLSSIGPFAPVLVSAFLYGHLCAAQVSAFPEQKRYTSPKASSRSVEEKLNDLFSARKLVERQPHSAQANIQLGRAFEALGEPDAASQAFERGLKLDPNNAEALFEKGSIRADKGEWAKAAELFRQAVALSADYVAAHLGLAEMLLRTGDFENSREELKTALRLDAKNAGAYQGLGLIDLEEGEFDAAGADFQHAVALRPGYLDAERGLARTFLYQHKWSDAATLLKRLVTTDPDSAEEALSLGTALSNLGDPAAKTQYEKARELSKKELISLRAKGENNAGVALRSQGKLVEAADAFRRALSEQANDCEAHDNLGGILWLQKDLAGALKEFQTAVDCNPNLASARNNLGIALLYHVHDLDGAIAQFHSAVALRPAFALAHFNLGKSLATKQDFAGAEPEFRKAIAVDPSMAAAHVDLGLALAIRNGRLSPEARSEMQKGLKLDPDLRNVIPAGYQAELH
jgi:tetratricopeptide (TPR) repeat protein